MKKAKAKTAKKKPGGSLGYRAVKRGFDIILGSIGSIFILPLNLIIKILYVSHGDHNPIFLKQYRIGRNGKQFRIWKYRTMVPGAEEKLEDILAKNSELREEYNRRRKLEDDPRVTKMGSYLRKASIDELPQFFNVFLGNMSFIGNRPYLLPEKDEMNGKFEAITSVKPGITGWWQVNGRSETDFYERLKLEEYYAKHQSLGLDFKILGKTVGTVISKKGAS